MTRKALGRGLSALIREVETLPPVAVGNASADPTVGTLLRQEGASAVGSRPEEPGRPSVQSLTQAAGAPGDSNAATGLQQILVALIDPNPLQPRRHFPEESIKQLAESIRSTGLLQPVLLRPGPIGAGQAAGRYQIVAGERRFHAARFAGLEAIPALVRPLGNQEMLEIALTENLLREDLNPIEVALAYHTLHSDFGLTHEQIAERVGVDRTTVTNALRLLRLTEAVQEMVIAGVLTEGHARALLAADSPEAQLRLARAAVAQGLSVRQLERMAATAKAAESRKGPLAPKPVDANIRAAARELERALGTRVRITGSGKRGKIEISYFSAEDLNRIYELIAGNSKLNHTS